MDSYEVVITDNNGCTATDSIAIDLSEVANLFVPNVFTPNGDGINDQITAFASPSIIKLNKLTIISRNGHVVFQRENIPPNDLNFGWDGVFNRKPAQVGVYILYVDYEDVIGQLRQEIHAVNLVR